MRASWVAAAALVLLVAAACGDDDGNGDSTASPSLSPSLTVTDSPTPGGGPAAAPTATSPVAEAPGPIGLTPALGGRSFDQPIELGAYPGGRVFVAEQSGIVLLLDRDGENERTLLDLRSVVRFGGEEGLLSVALDPAFGENGQLWVYYSPAEGPLRTRLSRFTVDDDAVDGASELVVLEVEQPFANHNGGSVRFGPDGMLYLSLGDGGAGGDPFGNGQDPSNLLSTIVRIDVRNASPEQPYVVPPDNPGRTIPDAREEVWAYGLRNPWRMAFDPATGTLWIGDVGQNEVEEINIGQAGANYGWDILEGNDCFEPPSGCDTAGTVPPVATYGHVEGNCSVTGGVVYRGAAVPSVAGAYLFGDFCSGRIWALVADLDSEPVLVATSERRIMSFGVDVDGEVYVLTFNGPILRIVPQ